MNKSFLLALTLIIFGFHSTSILGVSIETQDAGTYPVTFTYIDEESKEEVETTVYVTIEAPYTVTNVDVGEGIDASDFIVNKKMMEQLNEKELITKANAHAWNLNTGDPVPIATSEVKKLSEEHGVYSVRFSTENGTSVTIHALELTELPKLPQELYLGNPLPDDSITHWMFMLFIPILIMFVITWFLFLFTTKKTKEVYNLLYRRINSPKK